MQAHRIAAAIQAAGTKRRRRRETLAPRFPIPDSRFPVFHHLTFNVAKPTSTSTTEMIQKRTITRGSGQPFNSKW